MSTQIHNLIILDESGSMGTVLEPTISGFNELIQNIGHAAEKFPEQTHRLSFITFNSSGIKWMTENSSATGMNPLKRQNYKPSYGTPLYDAIGHACNKLRTWLTPETRVLVSILTDGYENASTEFSRQQIAGLVEALEEDGWTFTYMGTDQDVKKASLEINIKNSMHFSKSGIGLKRLFEEEKNKRDVYYQKIQDKKWDSLKEGYFDDENLKE